MKLVRLISFLLVVSSCVFSEDTTNEDDWNGDPQVCIPNSTPSQGGTIPYPVFPDKAEFTLEVVQIGHLLNVTAPSVLTKLQYLYDYPANSLILIRNDGSVIDVEYYYYNSSTNQPKKSTYYRREYCVVTDIPIDVENDGNSAIIGVDGKTHIRPMKEFLLFARDDFRKPPIVPKLVGEAVIRGIPAYQWETCIVDKMSRITEKRTWYFAAPGTAVPSTNPVGTKAVPLQAEIKRSIDDANGTQVLEIDTVFSVHTFRPGFIESVEQLAPPKGVFCDSGPDQPLGSLQDIQIRWPDRFSVRVDVSSSRSAQWQRFHLRYDRRDNRTRMIRYDFLPVGSQDYRSVIHDYDRNITYNIDLQTGGCRPRPGLDIRDISPIRDPIDFFIKNEGLFINDQTSRIWEFNGFRNCRGTGIQCSIVTALKRDFPPIVESDTGRPTGESWKAMSMEYAWATRAPLFPQAAQRGFDYPAHLYLRFYHDNPTQMPTGGGGFNRNEDIEYEFFELSEEISPRDFDVSTCYRANNYDYLHLGFVFKFDDGALDNGNVINRRALERGVHRKLSQTMGISISRVSAIEIDHETVSNNVTVFFTLLGSIPGVVTTEPNVDQAKKSLEDSIQSQNFKVSIAIVEGSTTQITFTAVTDSLKSSKQYMSIHSTGESVVTEEYSKGSEALAIILGLAIGLIVGIIIAVGFRVIRNEPVRLPGKQTSISSPLPVRFQNTKPAAEPKPTSSVA